MKNKFKFIFLLTPLLFLIGSTQMVSINKICADTVIDGGIDCVENITDCSSFGNYMVARDFFSSITTRDFTRQQAEASFGVEYPDGLRTLCINSNIREFIAMYVDGSSDGNSPNNVPVIEESRNGLAQFRIPRACPAGWRASQGPNTLRTAGIDITAWRRPWGCCPPNYKFINRNGGEGQAEYQIGACVRNDINASEIRTQSGASGNGVYDSSGNLLYGFNVDNVGEWDQYNSWEDLNNSLASNPPFIYSHRSELGSNVHAHPQLGLGLGNAYLDTNLGGQESHIRTGPTPSGAPLICPTNTACAISGETADINSIVPDDEFVNDANLRCNRCYSAGDVIGTSTPGVDDTSTPDVDEEIGFVRFCNADGTTRDETLLGTPDITRGYLLEDGANQALYKQCFDTGGIYTAIGCVDPTPTGIITGLIRIALGVMGGVALLQMVYVGILYQQGNTEKIKGARTQLIATITGIAVLVFSVLILRIIGVNILDTVANGTV